MKQKENKAYKETVKLLIFQKYVIFNVKRRVKMSIIVTHNDMDGIVSKLLIKEAIQTPVKDYEVDYSFDHKKLLSEPKEMSLYITDFSFKPKEFLELVNHFKNVIWIDHHQCIDDPDYDQFNKLEGVRRVGDCGAKLTMEYLQKAIGIDIDYISKYQELVNIVDAYDCWKKDSDLYEYGCLLNTYFYSVKNPNLGKLKEEVDAGFKTAKILNEASIIKRASMCRAKSYEVDQEFGEKCYADNCTWLVMEGAKGSLNFEAKYDNSKHIGMIAYNYLPKAKLWEVSLYSDHNHINCAEICKMLGGGGHKGAAGFQATTEKMIELGIF